MLYFVGGIRDKKSNSRESGVFTPAKAGQGWRLTRDGPKINTLRGRQGQRTGRVKVTLTHAPRSLFGLCTNPPSLAPATQAKKLTAYLLLFYQ